MAIAVEVECDEGMAQGCDSGAGKLRDENVYDLVRDQPPGMGRAMGIATWHFETAAGVGWVH